QAEARWGSWASSAARSGDLLRRSQIRHAPTTRIDGSLNSGTAALAVTRIRACASARSRWPERAAARPDFRCRVPQITTDTVDIRRHLEAVRQELRAPLGVLDLAEGHAEAAGDA